MRTRGISAIFAAVVFGLFCYFVFFKDPQPIAERPANRDEVATQPQADDTELSSGRTVVGGVERPTSDVQLEASRSATSATPPLRPQGFSAPVKPDANEQVASVAMALQDRKDAAKFSSFVVPNSFDPEKFASAPKEYASEYAKTVEPGRVYATAQPAEGVQPLSATSNRFHRLKQGESVRLAVKATPFAPVTFTSHDLGTFENQLTSITVVADGEGNAVASITAGGGTIHEMQILSGSPVNSGQVAFTLAVKANK